MGGFFLDSEGDHDSEVFGGILGNWYHLCW